jgi:hypothetical protein
MDAAKPVAISHEAAWGCRRDFSPIVEITGHTDRKNCLPESNFPASCSGFFRIFRIKQEFACRLFFISGERPLEFRSI